MNAVLLHLGDAALRALGLAVVAGLAAKALRLRQASLRMRLWTMVLGAALAMPLLSGLLPRWAPSAAARLSGAPRQSNVVVPDVPAAAVARSLRRAHWDVGLAVDAKLKDSTVAPARRAGWPLCLLGIYSAGLLLLLFRAALGWILARRLARSAAPVGETCAVGRLQAQAAIWHLRRCPRLTEAAALTVPLTLGVARPMVMLPAGWRQWSASQLDAVLAHELAHVAHRDTMRQYGSLLYRALFWFSPLGWWLHAHLGRLAEQVSDEAALAAGADPASYAETLLGFFSALRANPGRARWQAVAMAVNPVRRRLAERRVESVLSWQPRRPASRFGRVAVVGATLPLVGLFAAAGFAAPAPPRSIAVAAPTAPALARSAHPPPAAVAIAPAPLPPPFGPFDWTRAYVGQPTSALLADTQFNALLAAVTPDAVFHLGLDRPLSQAVTTLLRGASFPVTLRDGRYLTFSASTRGDRLALAWIGLDLERGDGFGAIVFNPSNGEPSPSLTFFSRSADAAPLPPALLADFDAWASDRSLPAPLATYLLDPNGVKSVLLHSAERCDAPPVAGFDPQLCQAMNLDRANTDMAAALHLLRQRLGGGADSAAALAAVDARQQSWLADRAAACGAANVASFACYGARTRARARDLADALRRLQAGAPGAAADNLVF